MPKSQYQIDLPVFAGPLDLLLHLIERNEMDITAISLVKITEQYLAQVEQMKQERIEELMVHLVAVEEVELEVPLHQGLCQE